MAAAQKALLVTELAKPVVLVDDYPISEPLPHQIQLKVTVAGLNPHDQKLRDWGLFLKPFQPDAVRNDPKRSKFMKDGLPVSLTNDVVGVVSKLGSAIPEGLIQVGDRVMSHGGFGPGASQNGLHEYTVSDVGAFTKIPDGTTDDEAATLPTNIIAPLVGLFSSLAIPAPWTAAAAGFDYAGTTLLIVGGGSNCGKFAVQLAKLAGVGRIVVVGGPARELEALGATHVLDRHGGHDAVLARIRAVVGDELVYAFDAVNAPAEQPLSLNALSSAKKGLLARLVPIGPVDESKVVGKKAGEDYEVRDVFGLSQAHPELCGGFWERVPGWLEDGSLKPLEFVVKEGLKAEHVNEVLDAYRDGKPVAKTHIHL